MKSHIFLIVFYRSEFNKKSATDEIDTAVTI